MSGRISDIFKKSPLLSFAPAPELMLPGLGIGIEIEVENWDGQEAIFLQDGRASGVWQHHRDDSLRNNGAEFTAGPICGRQVILALNCFERNARERNFRATSRTAFHVHVDCTADKDVDFVRRFTSVWMLVEPLLYEYVGQWRRRCGFCTTFYDGNGGFNDLVKAFTLPDAQSFAYEVRNLGRYAGLNLASLHKFGTIEVRVLPTVFDRRVWLHWINTIMCIYQFAENLSDTDRLRPTEEYFRSIFSYEGVWESLAPFFSAEAAKRVLSRANLLLRKALFKSSTEVDMDNPLGDPADLEPKDDIGLDIFDFDAEAALKLLVKNPLLRRHLEANKDRKTEPVETPAEYSSELAWAPPPDHLDVILNTMGALRARPRNA